MWQIVGKTAGHYEPAEELVGKNSSRFQYSVESTGDKEERRGKEKSTKGAWSGEIRALERSKNLKVLS